MFYICSLPNPGVDGKPKELFTDDPSLIERFAKAEDRPGYGVYECINPLKPGARRRCLETVAALRYIYFDIDLQNVEASREDVIRRLQQLPFKFTWAHDSGSGNLHVGVEIKDPPLPGTPEYDRGAAIWKRLVEKLAADPAPAHPAALVRRVGTHNSKNGNSGLCHQLWNGGPPQDLSELEALDELLIQPLLLRKPKPAGKDHDPNNYNDHDTANERKAPIDIDARLAAMRWHGPGDSAINITQRDVMASQLRRGVALKEAAAIVLAATRKCVADDPAAASIDWHKQELDILWSGARLINKEYELVDRLPDDLYAKFKELAQTGRRPVICRNNYGIFVRASRGATENNLADDSEPAGSSANAASRPGAKRVLTLKWFEPFDVTQLPPRTWLYGKHYQRRTVSLTAGPGGMGKSSLDMVEAIAMVTVRKLLGEQPEERLRVWFHNGEDPLDETKRRIAAICQHYDIPQEELRGRLVITSGNEFPLRVAKGYTNLEINTELIRQISAAITEKQIDLAIFDPLVTLHAVSELDTGKMDTVIRLFAGIADETNAGIEVAHHVRKPAAGSNADFDVHDIRGVMAITDAVRAARVLNRMNEKDAEAAGCDEKERLSRFRVDRAKGNYSPAQAATWRQFVNVDLPNGDEVGVVAPWDFPGQGEQTPQKAAADRKAEHVFIQLLDKFLARGQNVSANSGPTYAPAKFAEEREAKAAKVSKAALNAAMGRLLDANQIRAEATGRGDRYSRLVPWHGAPQ